MINSFDINSIEYTHFNERDVEIPIFLHFLKQIEIQSLLDVGGHYSWNSYALDIRSILGSTTYDAVDILPDEKTSKITTNYFVSNVKEITRIYDCVSCISTIEHSGISTYKAGEKEIIEVFQHTVEIADRYLFYTFPYGLSFTYPDQYTNITRQTLGSFIASASDFNFSCRFFYNPFPQGRKVWSEIPMVLASSIPGDPTKGVQCVGILLMEKK